MKLTELFSFNPKEQKFIKYVFIISFSFCLAAGTIAWIIQGASVKDNNKQDKHFTDAKDVELYKRHNKKILPIDIEAHKIAIQYLENDIEQDKLIKHLLRIQYIEKNNPEIKLKLATAYMKKNMHDKAKKLFKKLIKGDLPDTLMDRSMSRYGLVLLYMGRVDESISQLEKTITGFPMSKEAYCYRGEAEAAKNLASKKIELFFKKSFQMDSNYIEPIYQLSRYYMNKPQTNDTDLFNARKCLKKILDIKPLDTKTHSRLGMVYYYLNQPYLAEKSYKTALALNRNDYNTHYNLGELYFSQLNNRGKALEEFKETIRINNNHTEANFKIGLISLGNNMYKEAVRYFQKALDSSPANIRILLQLAVAYEKLNMIKNCREIYLSILDLDALNDIALQKLKFLSSGT